MSKQLSFDKVYKTEAYQKHLRKRYKSEKKFQNIGISSIILAFVFLAILLSAISFKAYSAFFVTKMILPVNLNPKYISTEEIDGITRVKNVRANTILKQSLNEKFQGAKTRKEKAALYFIISESSKSEISEYITNNPNKIGKTVDIWFKVSSKIDQYFKGNIEIDSVVISELEKSWIDQLIAENAIKTFVNWEFFSLGDSTRPENAGIYTSLIGSLFLMFVFMLMSFPLGILSAIYLEEFAPKNKLTDIIEININNLAGIPSVIFGLLGLSVFINFFGMPRSSALVGGLTLSLLVLPTIIIASRNSIRAIPKSIRDGALALGASPFQVVFHYVFPLALPGIFTGTILAIARALGETAPLLMVGMVAFITSAPTDIKSPTTVLPVQVYLWSDKPEIGFVEKTSAAILCLIIFLFLINLVAIILRQKFSKKW
jgi:phosphate transport system permease protein